MSNDNRRKTTARRWAPLALALALCFTLVPITSAGKPGNDAVDPAVLDEFQALHDLIEGLDELGKGEKQSLLSKLEAAEAKYANGQAETAANVLGAFRNRVEAMHDEGGASPETIEDLLDAEQVLSEAVLGGGLPEEPPTPIVCPISWQPNATAPVFYGHRDYNASDGAPGDVRVFFPSLDGSPPSAPLLEGCGLYPTILFAHGNCNADPDHYLSWFHLPAQLARAGYVVAVPMLPGIQSGLGATSPSDVQVLADTRSWLEAGWENASVVWPGHTGAAGHSWGGMLAGKFAVEHGVDAFAALASGWYHEWPDGPPRPIEVMAAPQLLSWGADDPFAGVPDEQFDALPAPKHSAVFAGSGHWDYLPSSFTDCQGFAGGECDATTGAAADIAVTFFGKYLPPDHAAGLPAAIPDSLVPPPLSLTMDQAFFAGAWFNGVPLLGNDEDCQLDLRWDTGAASGVETLP